MEVIFRMRHYLTTCLDSVECTCQHTNIALELQYTFLPKNLVKMYLLRWLTSCGRPVWKMNGVKSRTSIPRKKVTFSSSFIRHRVTKRFFLENKKIAETPLIISIFVHVLYMLCKKGEQWCTQARHTHDHIDTHTHERKRNSHQLWYEIKKFFFLYKKWGQHT